MPIHHKRAVLHAYPLINAKRQHGGMRIVIDNRSVGEEELRATLALMAEGAAGALHPLIVAFADEQLPVALEGWRPAPNIFPELRGEWLGLPVALAPLDGSDNPPWCLNGSPDHALDPEQLRTLAYTIIRGVPGTTADHLRIAGKPKVQTGVRTTADADALFAKGIDWVAGWPLEGATAQGKGRRADSRMVVVRLLQLVQADADISELEALLKQDVGLAFKLLRFINTVGNGLSVQVQSFEHAVMILGYRRLARWLALLVLASSDDPNQLPLMGYSLRRGFFMERLGQQLADGISPDELFMTGLFSLLDRVFAQPFAELLEHMDLPEAVSDALLTRGEPYGSLLDLAEAVEGDDPTTIRESTELLGLEAADVNCAVLLAIGDTQRIELH